MRLRLRKSPTPAWFVNSIQLTGQTVLVVVDDEGEVFDYWSKTIAERLSGIGLPSDALPKLIGIDSPSGLRSNAHDALKVGTLFLVDYRFKDDPTTGIDLVEELGLEGRAILVTNHFEQGEVLKSVQRLGIRLMPKVYMLNSKFPIDIGGES